MEDPVYERGSDGYGASPAPAQDSNVVGRRVAACLLDCFLIALLSSVAFAPLLFVRPGLILALLLAFVLLFCMLYLAYVVASEGFRGRTLGKALLWG